MKTPKNPKSESAAILAKFPSRTPRMLPRALILFVLIVASEAFFPAYAPAHTFSSQTSHIQSRLECASSCKGLSRTSLFQVVCISIYMCVRVGVLYLSVSYMYSLY